MSVCFLFGAGAEVSFGLCGGKEFAETVLNIKRGEDKKRDSINMAFKNYYKGKNQTIGNKNLDDWYCYTQINNVLSNSKEDSTDKSTYEDKIYKACIVKALIENNIQIKSIKSLSEAIHDYYNKLKSKSIPNSEKIKEWLLDNYPTYLGVLDNYFYTLISPKYFGPIKFWKVVYCYTAAYLCLSGNMLHAKNDYNAYLDILKNPEQSNRLINDFCENEKNLSNKKDKNSYYNILSSFTDKSFNVITTNYTPLCKHFINDNENKRIAYLNGRFGLFESVQKLKVYDVETEKLPNDEPLIPYIFLQTGLKPIVDKKQLDEYNKAIEFLNNSDELIVLGFRMNYDDNHINSLIRSFLCDDYYKTTRKNRNKKRLTAFIFKNENNDITYLSDITKSLNVANLQSEKNVSEQNKDLTLEEQEDYCKIAILNKLRIFETEQNKEVYKEIKSNLRIIFLTRKNDEANYEKFSSYLKSDKYLQK